MSSPLSHTYLDGGGGDDDDTTGHSRFTHRDLRLLGQSSAHSPLRVIALVDFDCFYAQCEAVRLGLPAEVPLGVQQFKHVIAVNYAARAAGLKKVVTAVEARERCPDIVLQHVPTWREGDGTWAYRDDVLRYMDSDKSSLDYYRLQSRRAVEVVKGTLPAEPPQRIEKAGIDEVFLDLSAQVHEILLRRYEELKSPTDQDLDRPLPRLPSEVLDWQDDQVYGTTEPEEDLRVPDWNDVALCIGAEVVRELRSQIHRQLRYTCSAGIARNKVLAKLAAGHNKPNKQTVVRDSCVASFLSNYKFTKLRGLGGKLGSQAVQKFGTDSVTALLNVSLKQMQQELGVGSGLWLFRVIRGIEFSEVVSRTQIKSMLSAKTFNPKIAGLLQAERWLRIFAADIMGRIDDQEGRRPRTIAIHHQVDGRFGPTRSKQGPIPLASRLDAQTLFTLSKNLLIDVTREGTCWPCLCMSVSVSDFCDTETSSHSLTSFWTTSSRDSKRETGYEMGRPMESANTPVAPLSKKRSIEEDQIEMDPGWEPQTSEEVDMFRHAIAKRQRHTPTPNSDTRPMNCAAVEDDRNGKYRCPNCQEIIEADHVLEHLDWHVAMDLQNQR